MFVLRPLFSAIDLFWTRTGLRDHGLFADVDHPCAAARVLTRCFYVGLLLIAFEHLSLWDYYVGLRYIQPLWPVVWAKVVPVWTVAPTVLLLFVLGSILAAVFPDRRLARLFAFAGCLEFFAFLYSFGTIRHVHHLLVLTTFMFIFLPDGDDDEEAKRSYLRAFWGAQCAALLTYSMSGLTKIATGSWQLVTQGAGIFTPDAFSLHVANGGIRFGVEPILGNLAIQAGFLGLPLYLGVMYLEIFSFPIAFSPALHRVWGVALIAMHLGVGLVLNLFFSPSIFVVGVLLLVSPFAPERQGWRRTVRDLPLIGRFVGGIE